MKNLIIITVFLFIQQSCSQIDAQVNSKQVKTVNASEFSRLINEENNIILDVRTPEEIREGYIKGAEVFINFTGCCFDEEINKLDTTKTYLVYCRSGARSGEASKSMIKKGFKNVYNLQGGTNNWSEPLITK